MKESLVRDALRRIQDIVAESTGEPLTAGADCGFSSQATYSTEVHPTVVWAKFQALRDGARLASDKLF